jgi:hypothetical protein
MWSDIKAVIFRVAGLALLANAYHFLRAVAWPCVTEDGFRFGPACVFALLILPAVILGSNLMDKGRWG